MDYFIRGFKDGLMKQAYRLQERVLYPALLGGLGGGGLGALMGLIGGDRGEILRNVLFMGLLGGMGGIGLRGLGDLGEHIKGLKRVEQLPYYARKIPRLAEGRYGGQKFTPQEVEEAFASNARIWKEVEEVGEGLGDEEREALYRRTARAIGPPLR